MSRDLVLTSFLENYVLDANGEPIRVTEPSVVWLEAVERTRDSGFGVYPNNQIRFGNVVIDNLEIEDLTANNALHLDGKVEADLNANSALTANNATNAFGKTEGQLNANSALTANNATYAYGKAEGALSVAQAANAALLNNKAEAALSVLTAAQLGGKLEADLNVNNAVTALTANNASNAFGKTEGQINANSATTAGNATLFDGQNSAYYRNADNLNAGTVPTARLGSGTANSTTFLAGDQTWQTVAGGGGSTNSYGYISVAGQANLVAASTNAQFLLVSGNGISLTTNVASDGALHVTAIDANTTVAGTVNTAAQIFAGAKTWNGVFFANNNATVNGTLLIQGATNQNNNITVNGFANVIANFQVGGVSTIAGNVTVTNVFSSTTNTTVSNANFTANMTLSGSYVNVATGTLRVGGLANLVGNTTFSGFANVGTTLQVAGLSTLTGNATFAGFINVQTSTLRVGGTTTLVGNTSITANLTVSANVQASHIGCNVAPHGNAVATFGGQYYSPVVDKANTTATMTIDWNNGNEQYANVNASVTFTFSNPVDGGRYVLMLKCGSSLTATWPATVTWANGAAPTLTTTSGRYDLFTFLYLAGPNKYFGTYAQNFS